MQIQVSDDELMLIFNELAPRVDLLILAFHLLLHCLGASNEDHGLLEVPREVDGSLLLILILLELLDGLKLVARPSPLLVWLVLLELLVLLFQPLGISSFPLPLLDKLLVFLPVAHCSELTICRLNHWDYYNV